MHASQPTTSSRPPSCPPTNKTHSHTPPPHPLLPGAPATSLSPRRSGAGAATERTSFSDDTPAPEPAINLSNRLNPNNVHFDPELANKWVGGRRGRGLELSHSVLGFRWTGVQVRGRVTSVLGVQAVARGLKQQATWAEGVSCMSAPTLLFVCDPPPVPPSPPCLQTPPPVFPHCLPVPPSLPPPPCPPCLPPLRYKRMSKAEKEGLWAQDRTLQMQVNAGSVCADLAGGCPPGGGRGQGLRVCEPQEHRRGMDSV